jgi:CRISPR/Cas system-associated exonuclease Cas4 (RecB family)
VKFKGFSVKVLPASQLNLPEQLAFSGDGILVGEPDIPAVQQPLVQAGVDMTPSDLTMLDGCFRYFHWTRIAGLQEPGCEPTGNSPQMRLGSIAHKVLETSVTPTRDELVSAGVPDLDFVFQSAEWRDLASAMPEREMPFMMHISVDGKECWVRGRMDATVVSGVPRVVDYKYATWKDGAEAGYDVQIVTYSLALMKALDTNRAVGELWYLKSPMKIIRCEYTREQAEERLSVLLKKYLTALATGDWPAADRSYCDRVECGFRAQCWSTA